MTDGEPCRKIEGRIGNSKNDEVHDESQNSHDMDNVARFLYMRKKKTGKTSTRELRPGKMRFLYIDRNSITAFLRGYVHAVYVL